MHFSVSWPVAARQAAVLRSDVASGAGWQPGNWCQDDFRQRSGVLATTYFLQSLNNWQLQFATDKMAFARRQMDAAHEMAHAVLHRGVSSDELKENLKLIDVRQRSFRARSAASDGRDTSCG